MNEDRKLPASPEAYDPRLPYKEGVERIIPLVEAMPPRAVVGYYRHISAIEAALKFRPNRGDALTPDEQNLLEEAQSTSSHLAGAFELLPSRDVGHAREVITAMARSPLVDDRRIATYLINKLTRYDHDYGVELWDKLIGDSDATIRMSAEESLPSENPDENPDEFARELAEMGLTREDVSRLRWTYLDHEEADESYR